MREISRARAVLGGISLWAFPAAALATASDGQILQSSPREVTLTLSEGTWMSTDVSPDGDAIAFDLLNDVYVMPASGGQARPILTGPAIQRSPQFSPDGRKILYLSDISGADNIWIANPDGTDPRQISYETEKMITAPSWAPDGRSIVATRTSTSVFDMKTSELVRFDAGGQGEQQLVPPPESGKDLQEPRFSPDGRYLYYTERVGGTHYVHLNPNLGNFVVRRRDLESGETIDLISGFGSATTPQVSPNGSTVAFVRRVGAKTVLFRYDVASGRQTAVYDGLARDLQADYLAHEHYYPAFDWFPDGRHVAIWAKGRLVKVDMNSGTAKEIPFRAQSRHAIHPALRTDVDLAPERVDVKIVRQIAPSPDGSELLFRALGRIWRQHLAADSPPRQLSTGDGAQTDPRWAPGGRSIAYVEWHDETGSTLRLRDAANGEERVLVHSGGIIAEPVFSNDGRSIAYRILDPDPQMGGAHDVAGLYIVGVDGEAPRYLAPARGVARFSPDDRRIYFMGLPDFGARRAVTLRSVAVEGGVPSEHAYAETADTGDFTLSPDLNWIAFKEFQELHVMPFRSEGEPIAITAQDNPAARRLTRSGGYELAWSEQTGRLFWTLGPDVFATMPGEPGAVERPLRTIALSVPADVPEGIIAFVNARILPMTGDDAIIENGSVVVGGNRIKAVGPAASVAIPRGAKVYDLAGKTLMPGFVDAHGHIDCCYGTGAMPQKHPVRYAALAYGVTTNFDPYANELPSYEAGELTIAGKLVGPRWLTTGSVIYGRSGKPDRVFNRIRNLEDARAVVRRKAAIGGTVLKSYKLTTRAQKQWLLRAAAEEGLMVDAEGAGHFYDNVAMILDGYTNLEHNLPVATYYDDLLQLFRHSEMATTPTLVVTFGELFGENYIYETQEPWKEHKVRTFIPGINNAYNPIQGPSDAPLYVRAMQSVHQADELYDVGFRSVGRSVKRLDDAGVVVNVGSHGQAAGIAMHWEMHLLAEGGMAPMRILRAATINGAKTWGLEHQLGSIEPGKLADLIVLEDDPLADIKNANSVKYTMVNGRLYDSATMNEIGNFDRPRSKFYWETTDQNGIDWNPVWAGSTRQR